MATYTVEIQASNEEGTIWQALAPAETVEDDGTAQELAEWVGEGNQTVASGTGWRVRVWNGADADTSTDPAAEYLPPALTSVDDLSETIAQTYVIDLASARDLVTTYVDQISNDGDLWHRDALTDAGVEVVTTAIAAGYEQGLHSSTEDSMLAELEDIGTKRQELDERRDELVRLLMHTSVARGRIAAAAGVKEARLYQIRDGRR